MNKHAFMKQLLDINQPKMDMTKFNNLIYETQEKFYRNDNNLCITSGQTEDDIFVVMKDIKKNECDHVAVQFNLKYGTINKFTRNHDNYINVLFYDLDKDILVTGGTDNSICVYNCRNMQLIKRVIVGQGSIYSLSLKLNVLYVGGCGVISMYELDSNIDFQNYENQSNMNISQSNYVHNVNLIKHIQILSKTQQKINFRTFTQCGQFDFWLSGRNSNEIYQVSINKGNILNLTSKLTLILRLLHKFPIKYR